MGWNIASFATARYGELIIVVAVHVRFVFAAAVHGFCVLRVNLCVRLVSARRFLQPRSSNALEILSHLLTDHCRVLSDRGARLACVVVDGF